MRRLEQFLLELGHGFAFVGRQYHFEVGDQDFYIDLLFFNWVQARFVVVELKVGRFEPEYVGKLGFYVSWIDDNLRNKDIHAPTVGILLCSKPQRQRRPVFTCRDNCTPRRSRLHL